MAEAKARERGGRTRGRDGRPREALKIAAFWLAGTAAILLAAEGALRLSGYPKGRFLSIYPPNARIEMTWGPVAYTVETNALGLRSREIAFRKPPGRTRILMIGDSVTEGFFADNPDTYPWRLEEKLHALDVPADVVNAGMGGGSIDKEFAVLASFIKLEPDLVLLTFVTNDLPEIAGKSRDDLVVTPLSAEGPAFDRTLAPPQRAARWLLTHTATAEAVFDATLRMRFRSYRSAERSSAPAGRYRIDGADDREANVREFMRRFAGTDAALLERPLPDGARAVLDDYLFALERVDAFCRERRARLVLAYFPSYPQIYDPAASMEVRDALQARCRAQSIPFCDLTPALRDAGGERVLHLAPVDFHLNPQGNEVIAQAVAEFLVAERLLTKS